jgi:site-specific DNA-methyltransferase (adenine-specific)
MIDLRLGRWQDVLGDVECDALITDPPYGAVVHAGNSDMARFTGLVGPSQAARGEAGTCERQALTYDPWSADDVGDFVRHWSGRTRGWMVAFTSDDLCQVWRAAYRDAGRYAFAPLPVIQPRVRLTGDGPASAAVYVMVSRPRSRAFSTWGALPGWYRAGINRSGHIGGKPVALMRAIVRDYSRPGDLVCDPCAGGGTTLRAALAEGRRAVGAEMDPETWRKARGVPLDVDQRGQQDMFA